MPADYRTYHDIVTGEAQRGVTVLATYGTEPVAVETERTIWVGFRPGHDHACLFPVYDMRQFGEPVWPFEINTATTAAERAGPRAWITRIVHKAGIERPLQATLDGKPAPQLELLTRVAPNGDRLIWIVNHEETGGIVTVTGPALAGIEAAAELLSGTPLPVAELRFPIGPGHVAIVATGGKAHVDARLAAQAKVPTTIPDMPAYGQD